MKRLVHLLGLQLAAIGIGIGTAGCGAPVDLESMDSGDEPVGEVQSAFQNSLTYVNCGPTNPPSDPIIRINEFATILSNRIYNSASPDGWEMLNCLSDSFLSYVNNAEWAGDIWKEFQRTGSTEITCASNLETACGSVYDYGGCAQVGISSEKVTIANQVILNTTYPVLGKAAILAHELAHNYGHRHPSGSDNDGEYKWTVPERAGSCAGSNLGQLPPGESRTNGMPGEVELGYVGRFGGTPFEFAGARSQFVTGLRVTANATINGLQVRFSDSGNAESWSTRVGGTAGVTTDRTCNAGDVVIGISGRARTIVNQLRIKCAPRNNLGASYDRDADGNANDIHYFSMCPAGKAVRQIRGRAGSSIDQLRVVCDDVGKSFTADHSPHSVGSVVGSTSGVRFSLRCSGNGGFTKLVGRATSGSGGLVQRLGGICKATGGTLPLATPGPEHPAIPWLGGHGGTAFTNACADGELMVGVTLRYGSAINAVGPVCAPANGWDNTSSGDHDLSQNGGTGGSWTRKTCPYYQFLVGLEAWGTDKINGLQIVCADMR
jgi:hypothetical protein